MPNGYLVRLAHAAVLALALLAPGITQARECDRGEVRRLQQLVRIAYNSYYFSSRDLINRCAPLYAAISYQQRVPLLLAECGEADALTASRQLEFLEDMAQDRDNCSF